MITALAPAVVLGLLSSVHCLGMCGPLALAVPSPPGGPWVRLRSALLLNSGRVLTYTLLGAAMGVFGRGLQLAGLQQVVSIGLGVVILAGLLLPRLLSRVPMPHAPARLVMHLQSLMARHLKRTSPEALFFTGTLNGLLPCGMVYLALAGAVAQGSVTEAALFMTAFGLGTWPLLLGLKLGASAFNGTFRAQLRRLTPVAYAVMAVLFIARGLDLGIPYLSPSLPKANAAAAACHTPVQ
ncbi:MAG: sulfite exporter TauE/SafE family protein [Flavobacteriales bacterium]